MNPHVLVVYVPGMNMTTKDWEPLISKLKTEQKLKNLRWLGWNHKLKIFSSKSVSNKASELKSAIDLECHLNGLPTEVILIGHSVGGIIVRQAYLMASGLHPNEPKSSWFESVTKITLLASLNRGLDQEKLLIRLYSFISALWGRITFRTLIVNDLISGSEYITNLRLAWANTLRKIPTEKRPRIIQILGTRDSLVSREDSIDFEQFPNAFHISVPDTDHKQLPLLCEDERVSELRYSIIRNALFEESLENSDPPISTSKHFEHVIFILHGIRDANREWVQSLSETLEKYNPNAMIVTPSYGYFSLLDFIFPSLHRRPLRYFQKIYSDFAIEHPNAKFHFIGHSNGTYILGKSLLTLPAMKFDRVILAGSVLPRNFDWQKLLRGKNPQINAMRNDCSNEDWAVGICCKALSVFRKKDIGTGGYEGFHYDDNERVFQNYWYPGGHSAALNRENFVSMASFIFDGSSPTLTLSDRLHWFDFYSRATPGLFVLIICSITIGLLMLFITMPQSIFITGAIMTIMLLVWMLMIA